MRFITPRTADSPAVGPGSLTCGFHYQIWIFKNKPTKNNQKSEHNHQCSGNANAFCYVCGEFVTQKCQRKITNSIKKLYKECFHIEIENQQSDWVPHVICGLCYNMLRRSTADKKFKFTSPTLLTNLKITKIAILHDKHRRL